MRAALRPYPAYKESSVDWLGQVPADWDVRRLKYLLREQDARSSDGAEQLLRVSQFTGVTERKRADGGEEPDTRAESLVGYKCVEKDDLVVNIMLAWNGSMGVSSFPGIVSPAYCVYRFGSTAQPWYYHHLLRSPAYKARIKTLSTGVVESRLRLYTDHLYRLEALLPPAHEQMAIVRFLNDVDWRIRRYIRAKQKLIKLLEEQRQVIIGEAVAGQIDVLTGRPHTAYRESGVQWLGRVPQHWATTRVKNEFSCLDRRRVPLSGPDRGSMTVRLYDYYGASGVIDKVEDYIFDDELLLIAEDGANLVLRNLPLAIIARGKFWVNNHAHILKPKRGNIEYLAAILESLNYQPWISGAAQPKLTQDRLMSIAIAVPSPEEQDAIMASIASRTRELSSAIEKGYREIELVREFGVRLMSDIVMGKLDVRAAAMKIPDEVDTARDEGLLGGDDSDELAEEEAAFEEVEA